MKQTGNVAAFPGLLFVGPVWLPDAHNLEEDLEMSVVYKSLREGCALPDDKGQCEEYRRMLQAGPNKVVWGTPTPQKKKLNRQPLYRNPGC
ncbi:hypothetical protein A6R68_03726, partial [Neotoma lepida]